MMRLIDKSWLLRLCEGCIETVVELALPMASFTTKARQVPESELFFWLLARRAREKKAVGPSKLAIMDQQQEDRMTEQRVCSNGTERKMRRDSQQFGTSDRDMGQNQDSEAYRSSLDFADHWINRNQSPISLVPVGGAVGLVTYQYLPHTSR